jgi:hypothetical protein
MGVSTWLKLMRSSVLGSSFHPPNLASLAANRSLLNGICGFSWPSGWLKSDELMGSSDHSFE